MSRSPTVRHLSFPAHSISARGLHLNIHRISLDGVDKSAVALKRANLQLLAVSGREREEAIVCLQHLRDINEKRVLALFILYHVKLCDDRVNGSLLHCLREIVLATCILCLDKRSEQQGLSVGMLEVDGVLVDFLSEIVGEALIRPTRIESRQA